MENEKLFEVAERDDCIWVRIWGEAGADTFNAVSEKVLAMNKDKGLNKMAVDIRDMKLTKINIETQAVAIGLLWHLRWLEKAGFLFADPEAEHLLKSSLNSAHVTEKFHSFSNEAELLAWLKT